MVQALTNDTLANLPGATPHGWASAADGCHKAPFVVNGPYWLGYDDPESLAWKAKYVNFRQLAGAMVMSADTDDFGASDEAYPLLKVTDK